MKYLTAILLSLTMMGSVMADIYVIDKNTGERVETITVDPKETTVVEPGPDGVKGTDDDTSYKTYTPVADQVVYVGETTKTQYKVPSVNAPTVSTGGNDMCKSGVSGGINGGVASISLGTTITDDTCEKIKLSRQLYNLGMKTASVAILCSDARVFTAMWESGTICPVGGMIGADAKEYWLANPEERPDYDPKKHVAIEHSNEETPEIAHPGYE